MLGANRYATSVYLTFLGRFKAYNIVLESWHCLVIVAIFTDVLFRIVRCALCNKIGKKTKVNSADLGI